MSIESMLVNVEPSIKMPQLKAYSVKISGDQSWIDPDVVKVIARVVVTNNGYELVEEEPSGVLKVMQVSK